MVDFSMDVSSPKGLADHAETLSDYLHEYGRDVSEWSNYSKQFFEYLLSVCWQKIHLRFSSWRRLGFIRNFEERFHLLEEHLKSIGTSFSPSERGAGDRSLTQFLHVNGAIIFEHMLPIGL